MIMINSSKTFNSINHYYISINKIKIAVFSVAVFYNLMLMHLVEIVKTSFRCCMFSLIGGAN